MDTTLRKCKICEEEFDSIYEIDNGICDECLEKNDDEEIGDECTCFECGQDDCPLHGCPI